MPDTLFHCKGLDRPKLSSQAVKSAMSRVPRHEFVLPELESEAYLDKALSIGFEQTISQPFIVALMTQAAAVSEGSKVLEIGTGSGYQAAVLAECGAKVVTLERIPELSERAAKILRKLAYSDRVTCLVGDGWYGQPEFAPYDAIIVTAASPKVPIFLLEQLLEGGRLVIPLETGAQGKGEELMQITKTAHGSLVQNLGPVRFVPLLGEARKDKAKQD